MPRLCCLLLLALLVAACGDAPPTVAPLPAPTLAPAPTIFLPPTAATVPSTLTPDAAATAASARQAQAEADRATLVAGALATQTAEAPTATRVPPTHTPLPPPTDTPPPPFGGTQQVGSWEVHVTRVRTAQTFIWSDFGNKATARGIFVLVSVTALNISGHTDSINSFDYALTDATGARYETDSTFAAAEYASRVGEDSFGQNIPPRLTTNLLAVFDVTPGAQGLILEIEHQAEFPLGKLP